MNEHIRAFFNRSSDGGGAGHFRKVIALHEGPDVGWEEISQLVPRLPRGWYELSQLPEADRIEFTRDFWFSQLPFQPHIPDILQAFFADLNTIGVYLTQQQHDEPYEAHMVYGVHKDTAFFRGGPPATENDIVALKQRFSDVVLPEDYLAFLGIHDGFYKYTDTGVTPSAQMGKFYEKFQDLIAACDQLLSPTDEPVDPKTLIPFYESFGFPCYQCFWSDWYPSGEMGNIYYCGLTNTISDHRISGPSPENMAFPTFLDWLAFYLETIEI